MQAAAALTADLLHSPCQPQAMLERGGPVAQLAIALENQQVGGARPCSIWDGWMGGR